MASIIVWYIILQHQQQKCLFSSMQQQQLCLLTYLPAGKTICGSGAAPLSDPPWRPRGEARGRFSLDKSPLFRKQRPLQQLKPRALSRPRGSVQKTCIFKSQSWRATTTITELPYHHLWMKKIQNHIQYSRNNFHPEELSQL